MRETLKSQLAILFILLLIFFCQKLVKILGAAVDGEIPTNLVLSLLGLGVPEMAQLILPLSLFLGLLMTLGKLYTESEITVMHACGKQSRVGESGYGAGVVHGDRCCRKRHVGRPGIIPSSGRSAGGSKS
ncbi:LptF/LptG family permease [Enterobacter mori]